MQTNPFARALVLLLSRTGWGLRVFLDDTSLLAGFDPDSSMQQALESTQVALLLFSKEFFLRSATMSELKLLLERHKQRRAQLLPVFLRLTVEECKIELRSLRQPGVPQPCCCCRLQWIIWKAQMDICRCSKSQCNAIYKYKPVRLLEELA